MLEHLVEGFLAILIPACELMGISIVAVSAVTAASRPCPRPVARNR